MRRNGRIDVLLLVLAYIAKTRTAKVSDLIGLTGYSRTALFRLFRIAKDDLMVRLVSVRGQGYEIEDWGLLNGDAVLKRYGETVEKWTGKKSSRKSRSA